MKTLWMLLVIITITACGKKKEVPPITPPSPPRDGIIEFSGYLSEFEDRMFIATGRTLPRNLQVVFSTSLPENILGTCTMGQSYVKINQYLWDRISTARREELIFHELGHCVLNRYHTVNAKGEPLVDDSGYPISIMNPYNMGPAIYNRSTIAYQSYMGELFNVSPSVAFAGLTFDGSAYASFIETKMASILNDDSGDHYHGLDNETITCFDE